MGLKFEQLCKNAAVIMQMEKLKIGAARAVSLLSCKNVLFL